MLGRGNNHLLFQRGRKAGLTARELNLALSSQPVRGDYLPSGQTDCNGYVWYVNDQGLRVPVRSEDPPQDEQ